VSRLANAPFRTKSLEKDDVIRLLPLVSGAPSYHRLLVRVGVAILSGRREALSRERRKIPQNKDHTFGDGRGSNLPESFLNVVEYGRNWRKPFLATEVRVGRSLETSATKMQTPQTGDFPISGIDWG
jgi:hypothetical protein